MLSLCLPPVSMEYPAGASNTHGGISPARHDAAARGEGQKLRVNKVKETAEKNNVGLKLVFICIRLLKWNCMHVHEKMTVQDSFIHSAWTWVSIARGERSSEKEGEGFERRP